MPGTLTDMEAIMNETPGEAEWPGAGSPLPLPEEADHASWQALLDDLLVREKAHTREGEASPASRPVPDSRVGNLRRRDLYSWRTRL